VRGPYQWIWESLPRSLRDRAEVEPASIRRFVENAARATPEGSVVLDAGAGDSRHRALYRHTRYVTLDSCKVDKAYAGIDVVARLEELPLASGAIDAVLCTQVLEHVPDPLAVLKELNRALWPHGTLWLTVPLLNEEHEMPQDFFRFTRFGLAQLLERAGFHVVLLEPRGGYFWQLGWQLRRLPSVLFPPTKRPLHRVLRWPLAFACWCTFGLLIPWILYPLDRFDSEKTATLGFACQARKIRGVDFSYREDVVADSNRATAPLLPRSSEPALATTEEKE